MPTQRRKILRLYIHRDSQVTVTGNNSQYNTPWHCMAVPGGVNVYIVVGIAPHVAKGSLTSNR